MFTTLLCIVCFALAIVLHKCAAGQYGTTRTRNV